MKRYCIEEKNGQMQINEFEYGAFCLWMEAQKEILQLATDHLQAQRRAAVENERLRDELKKREGKIAGLMFVLNRVTALLGMSAHGASEDVKTELANIYTTVTNESRWVLQKEKTDLTPSPP